jgi:hypothetical protein
MWFGKQIKDYFLKPAKIMMPFRCRSTPSIHILFLPPAYYSGLINFDSLLFFCGEEEPERASFNHIFIVTYKKTIYRTVKNDSPNANFSISLLNLEQ